MRIKTQDYNDVTVMELQGELTADFVEMFRNACSNVVARNKADEQERVSQRGPTQNGASGKVSQSQRSGRGVANAQKRRGDNQGKHKKLGIVLDMSKVGFIDSQALEELLWLRDCCRENGRELKLAGLDENCAKILEITRLEEKFDRYAELAEAVKSFA